MAVSIFPQTGDASSGSLFAAVFARQAYPHVSSGLLLSDGGGTGVEVAPGEALVSGVFVESDSTETLTLPNNATSYVGLQVTYDAAGEVETPSPAAGLFSVDATQPQTETYLPLAKVQVSGGQVGAIEDLRWRSPTPTMTSVKATAEQRVQKLEEIDQDLCLPVRAGRLYHVRFSMGLRGHMDGGTVHMPTGATQSLHGFALDGGGTKQTEARLPGSDRFDIRVGRGVWQIEGTVQVADSGGRVCLWWEGDINNPGILEAGSLLQVTDLTY